MINNYNTSTQKHNILYYILVRRKIILYSLKQIVIRRNKSSRSIIIDLMI